MNKKETIKILRVELPEGLRRQFKTKAVEQGMSMSQVIRTLIKNYLYLGK